MTARGSEGTDKQKEERKEGRKEGRGILGEREGMDGWMDGLID